MSYYIGQRVICINDTPNDYEPVIYPKKGRTYTIRAFNPPGRSIHLEEIVNKPRDYSSGFHECYFYLWRFRPVHERKTDISIFTAMLKTREAVH